MPILLQVTQNVTLDKKMSHLNYEAFKSTPILDIEMYLGGNLTEIVEIVIN